jgi:hypothetical protein
MSERKPVFLNLDGGESELEEMATTDTATFGGLSVGSTGIGLTGGGTITGLPSSPSGDTEAASKSYVDSVAAGLTPKDAVRVRAQGNIDLAAPGANIDSVAMAVDDRVLCDQQSTSTQDGIYLWKGAAVAMERTTDAATGADLAGAALFVKEGTDDNKGFVCTNDKGSGVVGTDDLVFSQFTGLGQITAGDGLTKDGDTIDVNPGNGISVAGDAVAVDPDSETGGNIQPVNLTSNGVGLDVSAIAGTGVEADGSANLQLATQGNGIAGGSGSVLSVDPDSESGGDIQPVSVGSDGVGLDVSAIAGSGLEADGSANLQVHLEATNPSLQIDTDELGVKLSDGLTKDANGTAVNLDASASGLEFTGAAGDGTLGIKLEASDPSLQIDGSNQLGAKLNGNKGLQKDASGIEVKVDDSTIQFNGSGQLEAIGSDEATRVENTLTTATDATADGDPVYINGSDTIGKARADNLAKSAVIGVIRTGSGVAGSTPEVVSHGPCAGVLSGATPGAKYFLQSTGGIGTSLPGAGEWVIRCGFAKNADDLWVKIRRIGRRAA